MPVSILHRHISNQEKIDRLLESLHTMVLPCINLPINVIDLAEDNTPCFEIQNRVLIIKNLNCLLSKSAKKGKSGGKDTVVNNLLFKLNLYYKK